MNHNGSGPYQNIKRHMTEEQIKDRQAEADERAEKIRDYIKDLCNEKLYMERKCPITSTLIDSGE